MNTIPILSIRFCLSVFLSFAYLSFHEAGEFSGLHSVWGISRDSVSFCCLINYFKTWQLETAAIYLSSPFCSLSAGAGLSRVMVCLPPAVSWWLMVLHVCGFRGCRRGCWDLLVSLTVLQASLVFSMWKFLWFSRSEERESVLAYVVLRFLRAPCLLLPCWLN